MANTAPELAPNFAPAPRVHRPSGMEWIVIQLAQAIFLWPWLILLSAPIGYRPVAVDHRRITGEPHRWRIFTALSTFGWMGGPFIFLSLVAPPILLVTVPIMMAVTARKSASPYGLPLRDAWATGRRVVSSSGGWVIASRVILGCLAVLGLLILLASAATAFDWRLPAWLQHGFWAILPVVIYAWALAREIGQTFGASAATEAAELDRFAASVAGVLNVRVEHVYEQGMLTIPGDGSLILSPLPPQVVVKGRDDLEARVVAFLPDYTVTSLDAGGATLELAPEEVLLGRRVVEVSGGLVVGFADEVDSIARPHAVRWLLTPGLSPAQAPAVASLAAREGSSLIDWHPYEDYAILAKLSVLQRRVRDAIASGFGVAERPWDVEVEVVEGDPADAPVQSVKILRAPVGLAADRRARAIAEALLRIPGGHADWAVEDDLQSGVAELTYRSPRVLASLVPLSSLTPAELGGTPSWSRLPIGRDDKGQPVIVDLKLGPHAIYVGTTGSGKSISIIAHLVAALLRGHRIAVIDIGKGAPDYASMIPWMTAVARDTPEEAVNVLNSVYEEGLRRKAVARQYGVGFWEEIPADVRAAEDIVPMTVVVDEFPSFVEMEVEPKGLPRDHPMLLEAQQINLTKALSVARIGKILRELRSWGIHLIIGTQTADYKIIPVALRNQMVSRVQLALPGNLPPRTDLGMLFDADRVVRAERELITLDDGASRGLAVISATGGLTQGLRTGYATQAEIPELLAGVPLPPALRIVPLDLDAAGGSVKTRKAAPTGPVFGTEVAEPMEQVELLDLDDLLGADFSFDDLDADFTPPDLTEGWGK